MAYYLMNKDVPWLLFSCERDEYDEVQLKELKWLTELRPLGYADLFVYAAPKTAAARNENRTLAAHEPQCQNASTLPNILVSIEPARYISTGQTHSIQLFVLANDHSNLLGNILLRPGVLIIRLFRKQFKDLCLCSGNVLTVQK